MGDGVVVERLAAVLRDGDATYGRLRRIEVRRHRGHDRRAAARGGAGRRRLANAMRDSWLGLEMRPRGRRIYRTERPRPGRVTGDASSTIATDAGLRPTAQPPARISLRVSTPADKPALTQVLVSNAALLPLCGIGAGAVDMARLGDVLEAEAGREHGSCVTVVERSTGHVIGLAVLLVPNPLDGTPWIALLIIAADHQGLGLGTEAALALERLLARAGWSEVRLSVLVDNPRALRFWQRLGYRELAGVWRA